MSTTNNKREVSVKLNKERPVVGEFDTHATTPNTKEFARSKFEQRAGHKLRESIKFALKDSKRTWKNKKYTPQAGTDSLLIQLKECSETMGKQLPDHIWSTVEGIILVVCSLSECVSTTQAISIVLLWVKTHIKNASICSAASAYVSEIFECEAFDIQSGTGDGPEWLTSIRSAFSNWEMLIKLPIFSKISTLLSALVTLGICDASSLDWKIGSIRIFSQNALEKHLSAKDIIDAVFSTIIYFVESGYESMKTGSVAPFLYSDTRAVKLEADYYEIIANAVHVKTGNLLKVAKITENDFAMHLSKTMTSFHTLIRSCRSPVEKRILELRYNQLQTVKREFDGARTMGGLRESPFGVCIFGSTGVGKSTLSTITMSVVLKSTGHNDGDEFLVTLNEHDKFMSNYKTHINGIFIDDVGNTKKEFLEKAPTQTVIEIINNVPMYAVMAELEQKGQVSVEPKALVITTNCRDLNSFEFSNEPASILRRFPLHVVAKVKAQFKMNSVLGIAQELLDPAKVEAHYTNEFGIVDVPPFPDIWDISVFQAVPFKNAPCDKHDNVTFALLSDKDGELKDIDIFRYLKYLVQRAKEHSSQQKNLVERSKNFSSKYVLCEHDLPSEVCGCQKDKPQSGLLSFALSFTIRSLYNRWAGVVFPWLNTQALHLEVVSCSKLISIAHILERSFLMYMTNWIPNDWLNNPIGKAIVLVLHEGQIRRDIQSHLYFCYFWIFLSFMGTFFISYVFVFTIVSSIMYAIISTRLIRERIYDEIVTRNNAVSEVCRNIREKYAKMAIYALGAVGTLYYIVKVFRAIRRVPDPQGNIAPTHQSHIDARDMEINPWANVQTVPVPGSQRQRCQTVDQAEARVATNLVQIQYTNGDVYHVNGFFVKSNLMLLPQHFWYPGADMTKTRLKEMKVSIIRCDSSYVGSKFNAILSSVTSCDIPDTDLCLTYVPNAGSYADLSWMFPDEHIPAGQHSFHVRSVTGKDVRANAICSPGAASHIYRKFMGGYSTLDINTYNGMCMGVYLSKGKAHLISGFHLGGKSGAPNGVFGTLTLKQLTIAVTAITKIPSVLNCASEGTIMDVQYGKSLLIDSKVDPKCPSNFLSSDTHLQLFGTTLGRATYNSQVVNSSISESVTEITGCPQQWGPPRNMKSWKPWRQALEQLSSPSMGMEGSYLRAAMIDYQLPILQLVDKFPKVKSEIAPLTRLQVLAGIDGRRFIDKMAPSTSVGFPLSGPKSDYLTYLDPKDFDNCACPVELDPMFWTEFDRCEQLYLSGERTYPVFKASLKDEATSLSKDKVRVFQAAPMVLQLLMRKYFLPVARTLSLFPLVSEIAVGVNAQGPEWNDLSQHMLKFGKDRVFAGDYSKYDQRMPASMVAASFKILIDIAKHSGNYTDDELIIMQGIATDVMYPMMAYNGTLLQLFGSNPSGQNLTVYVNSIVNALLLRCFAQCLGEKQKRYLSPFRSYASMMTYGDDVKGSVRAGYDDFSIIGFSRFLADRDMKFTMPDKESELVAFTSDSQADFLKRTNIYNPEVDMYFGALSEKSIFKSLHCAKTSSINSEDELAVMALAGAMGEWFLHGRELYEKRRSQMLQVAQKHNLVCPFLEDTYDIRVHEWKQKYLPDSNLDTAPTAGVGGSSLRL